MKVTIQATGYIGKDARVHSLTNGKIVFRFPLATHTMVLGEHGYYRRITEWHKCEVEASDQEASLFCRLSKGTMLALSGRLGYRKWETQTLGGRRTVKQAYIKVDHLEVFRRGRLG